MPIVNDDGVFESAIEAAAVDWSKLNQPTGEAKLMDLGDSPISRQIDDFKVQAAKPAIKSLSEGSDESIKTAMDIVTNFGAGTIAGPASKTANQINRFKAALDLEVKGKDAKEVLNEYGWFRDPKTGRMKYEISDEGMRLTDKDWKYGEVGKLSDFVEHPELYKAYPHIADVNFKVADKDFKYIGSWSNENQLLTINTDAIKAGNEGILDVLAHEIQHIVQRKEGWSGGSNPTRALEDVGNALLSKMGRTENPEVKKELVDLYLDIQARAKDFGEYMYLRNPGEVEANMVAARRKLSDEMRKKFPVEEHKKLVEGEVNTLHGGKYLPEFYIE